MITSNYTIFGRRYSSDIDADAQAFITATAITNSTIITAINNLVVSLKSDGLWNKIYFLYPMVGGTATTHSYNLRNILSYQLTFNGTWTHSSNGALPNGSTGYADTLFTPLGIVGQNNFGISKSYLHKYNIIRVYRVGKTSRINELAVMLNRFVVFIA